jgi:hypothetical protein
LLLLLSRKRWLLMLAWHLQRLLLLRKRRLLL